MIRDLIRRSSRILLLSLAVALGSFGWVLWQCSAQEVRTVSDGSYSGDRPVSNPGGWVGCDSAHDDAMTRATNGTFSRVGMRDATVCTGVNTKGTVRVYTEQNWTPMLIAIPIVAILFAARRKKHSTLFSLGVSAAVLLTVAGILWGLSL